MQRSIFVLCLRRVPFFRQALLHRERVSDGCLSSGRPFCIGNVSPTAYVPSSFSFVPPAKDPQKNRRVIGTRLFLASSLS